MSPEERAEFDSIHAKLDAIGARLDSFLARSVSRAAPATNDAAPRGGDVASDGDLDNEYGDPTVRKDPGKWTGESFAGCRYSDCPPEYLDMLASLLDWMAGKSDEDGKAGKTNAKGYPISGKFQRLDAARARGWARRKRAGWQAPAATETSEEIPF